MNKLFSYGTLQQENVQLATFGRLLDGQADSIIGFVETMLEITDPEVIETSGKTHHPIVSPSDNPGDSVRGTVFLITDQELEQSDRYEVSDYERVQALLASGGVAWVYVARKSAE